MKLRDYQEKAIDDIYNSFRRGNKNVMLQLPTGGGKSIVTAKICKDGYQNGRRVLVLAHREELVKQAANHISNAIGVEVGIIKAGIDPNYDLQIQVASVQTIINKFDKVGDFNLVICDEAHHSTANTYKAIYNRYHTAKLLGVTATPIRLNGKGFKDLFDDLVTSLTTQQLIELGHLSKFKLFASQKQMNFEGVGKKLGEYSQAEIADINDPTELAGDVVASYERYAKGSQCLVFATSVEHSQAIAKAYNQNDINAIHLDGTTPSSERAQALVDFIDKKVQVISNCSLFGEGLDIPALETVQIARRTASVSLHLQMCLDMETEVLTEHGFRKYYELTKDEKVASFDIDTEEIVYEKPLEYIFRLLGEGEKMVSISSPTLDLRVTNLHNMVWKSRTDKDWRISTAQILADRKSQYKIPIAGFAKTKGLPLTNDEIRFLGWFLTDGSLSRKSGQVSIYQSAHQPWLHRIEDCLKMCGFKFNVDIRECTTSFGTYTRHQYYLSKGKPRGTDKHLRGWESFKKYLNKDLGDVYNDISRDQLAVLLEEMHYGDGTKMEGQSWTRRSYHISTGNIDFANNLQRLCVTRGFKCNLATTYQNGDNPLYFLHIKDTSIKYIGGCSNTDRDYMKECESSPDETVWCLRTQLGTLVTRRNGKVSIMGNCGRVLRVAPNKPHAIVIDHTDNWKRLGLPTKPRNWSLKGVKDDKPQELEIDEETEEVIVKENDEKLSMIPIVNDNIILNEILTPNTEAEMWEYEFNQLVHTLEQRGYKPSWLGFRLAELRPPLVIWRLCAKYCGHHWKWADHKFEDQQNKSQQVLELV